MLTATTHGVWNDVLPFDPELIGVNCEREETVRQFGWSTTIDSLLDIRDLPSDWDGNGAVAPPKDVVDSALHLAIHLKDRGMREPNGVVPGVNGTVIFDWQGTDKSYLEIEVSEPFHAEAIFIAPGRETQTWTFSESRPGIAA